MISNEEIYVLPEEDGIFAFKGFSSGSLYASIGMKTITTKDKRMTKEINFSLFTT
jgi:hypothetical protein